jgi:hypothetical protein
VPRARGGARRDELRAGAAQIRKGAVTTPKIKAGTLLATHFKRGQLPAGPPGPAGPAGTAGLSEYEIVSGSNTNSNSYANGLTVNCRGGKRAIAGGPILGYFHFQYGPFARMSAPTANGADWRVETHTPGLQGSWQMTVYVICARVS